MIRLVPDDNKSARKDDIYCPYCQRRFDTPDELTLHVVTRHTQSGITRDRVQTGNSTR